MIGLDFGCWVSVEWVLRLTIGSLQLFQTLAAARMLTPSGPMGQTHWGDAASNSPTPTTQSADAQLKVPTHILCFLIKSIPIYFLFHLVCSVIFIIIRPSGFDCAKQQELAAVFKKIGDKQTCTIGLYELYRITQLYPKVNEPTCFFILWISAGTRDINLTV